MYDNESFSFPMTPTKKMLMLPFKKVELLGIWQFVLSFCRNFTDESRANKSPLFVQNIAFHVSKQKT